MTVKKERGISRKVLSKAITATLIMLVVSVGFFVSNSELHAATKDGGTVKTWNELKKAIETANKDKTNTYEITLDDDLVAQENLTIKGNVKLKSTSAKTIYRKEGDTDFSVFKVADGGKLDLSSNVQMSGDVASTDTPDKYHIYFKDGVGNIIYDYAFTPGASGYLRDVMYGKIPRDKNDLPSNGHWGIKSIESLKDTWLKYLSDLPNTSPAQNGYEFSGWEYPEPGDFWANDYNLAELTGDVTLVAQWDKISNDDAKKPISNWNLVDDATTKDGFVLMGYVDETDPDNPVFYAYGQQKLTNNSETNANRSLFKTFDEISDNNGNVTNELGYFKWFNTPARTTNWETGDPIPGNQVLRQLAVRSDNPNANAWGEIAGQEGIDPQSQAFHFTSGQPVNWNKKPEIKRFAASTRGWYELTDGYTYCTIGDDSYTDAYLRLWTTTQASDNYNSYISGKRHLLRMDDGKGTGYIGLHDNVQDSGNYTDVSGQSAKFWKLGFFTVDQVRALSEPDWTYTQTDEATKNAGSGGAIKKDGSGNSIHKAVEYSTNPSTNEEKFSGDKGFFVHVQEGGSLTISGATLHDFKTHTISGAGTASARRDEINNRVPKNTAPVYVEGGDSDSKTTGFTMTSGYIENNKVGYTAVDAWSKDKSAQQISNYLKEDPFTNTAGGVIFTGKNTVGSITGDSRIRMNKGDAGGIIVTDGATVTLGKKDGNATVGKEGGINKNIGFHHAGAALVQHDGTLIMTTGGEMFSNVTWSKGGAVWATEWGTNGYVDADWSNWPRSYPVVKNPEDKGTGGAFIMTGGGIHANTAFLRAGAIEVESNDVNLYGGTIYDNNCRSLGGAIYVEGDAADYSYTLYVKEGYIGENVAVKIDDATTKSVTQDKSNSVNYVLDRYIDDTQDNKLKYCENESHKDGKGYTPDYSFSGAMGNGGGVWLCPVGGTSVFADDKVIIDSNNVGTGGSGTDFYLHRGNGNVMVQNLNGVWYNEPKQDGDQPLSFDAENGTVLNGPVAMGNYNPTVTTKDSNTSGVKIYNNQSRDGGAIACNGTLMFGGPSDVYRYDARVVLDKIWDTTKGPEDGEQVEFDLYYKKNNVRGTEPFRTVTLDGTKDVTDEQSGSNQEGKVGGQDIDGEWDPGTKDGKTMWQAGVLLPQYVEIDGQRQALYEFEFEYEGTKYTLDPVTYSMESTAEHTGESNVLKKLYEAVQAQPEVEKEVSDGNGGKKTIKVKELPLNVKTYFEIVEKGNKYKTVQTDLSASAVATSEEIKIHDPVTGGKTAEFYVTFSTATMSFQVTNKDKPQDVDVTKKWLDHTNVIEATKKPNGKYSNVDGATSNNLGTKEYVNWPGEGSDSSIRYQVSGNGTTKADTITAKQIRALINNSGATLNVKKFNEAANIEDRSIEFESGGVLKLEKKEYYTLFIGDELIYAEEKEECEQNTRAYYNVTNFVGGKYPSDYIAMKAKEKLIAQNRKAEADGLSWSNVNGGKAGNETGSYIYFPKLTYSLDKYDSSGNEIAYSVAEVKINNVDVADGKASGYTYVLSGNLDDGFVATNKDDRKEIYGTKKWKDNKGELLLTQKPNGDDGFTSVLKNNTYLNWGEKDASWIRLAVENTATGSTVGNQYIDVDVQDIKDLMINNSLRKDKRDATFHADNDIEKRYIAYIKDNKVFGKLSLKKETIDDKIVYSPILTYLVPNGQEYRIVEKGINNYSGNYGIYLPSYDQNADPMLVTNTVNKTDISTRKVWLDEDGNIMLTKEPSDRDDKDSFKNNLGNYQGYERYINWPTSGVNGYTLKLDGGKAGVDRTFEVTLDDIKAFLTNSSNDMPASDKTGVTKTFNGGGNVTDRSIVWRDSNDTVVTLKLDMVGYCVLYDVDGNIVYSETKASCDENLDADQTVAQYMVAKGRQVLAAKGMSDEEINDALGANPEQRFTNRGEKTYVYIPTLTFNVDHKNTNAEEYTYTLDEIMIDDDDSFTEYKKVITGNTTNGYQVTNQKRRIEIPVSKKWTDYDGNFILSQGIGDNNGINQWFKDEDGNNVWVNWPDKYASYITFKLDAGGGNSIEHKLYAANPVPADDPSIQKALSGEGNKKTYTLDGKPVDVKIEFDTEEYYVVIDKENKDAKTGTGDNIVLTMSKKEADSHAGQNLSGAEYALLVAAQASGKDQNDFRYEQRKVYFPKLVYNVDKYDDNNQPYPYVVTEVDVASVSVDDKELSTYNPIYYDANGKEIDVKATVTNNAKQQAMLRDGITVYNDQTVAVQIEKEWMNESGDWPDDVDEIQFRIKKIDWTTDRNEARLDEKGNPVAAKNADGTTKEGYYEKLIDVPEKPNVATIEKGDWKGTSKKRSITWVRLPKYSKDCFDNNRVGIAHEDMMPNRYYVVELPVEGYDSDISWDCVVDRDPAPGRKNVQRFTFKATNKELTDVKATKTWKNAAGDTIEWPGDNTATFELKRWYKYDSFHEVIYGKVMSTDLYIEKDGKKVELKKDVNNKYYVEIDDKTHYVQQDAYIEIDGYLYALKSDTNADAVDENGNKVKALVTPKDSEGQDITGEKTVTKDANEAKWEDLPKYDADFKVGTDLNPQEKREVRQIWYSISEKWINGYRDSVETEKDKDDNDIDYEFNVINKENDKTVVDIPAEKIWDDGGADSRPTIKFELWKLTYTYDWNANSGSFVKRNDNAAPAKMEGNEYEHIIDQDSEALKKTWENLPIQEFEGQNNSIRKDYYYGVREAVKVGTKDGKDVYVYVTEFNTNKATPTPGKIIVDNKTISVKEVDANGNVTDTLIKPQPGNSDANKNGYVTVDVVDESALGYIANVENYKVKENADGCGRAWGLRAYNTKPAIEKYVNKDVHEDLKTKNEIFTYDIMAYVPRDSQELTITDPLVDALEFVDSTGTPQSDTTEFVESKVVKKVEYMATNNHQAKSANETGASVVKGGQALTTGYTTSVSGQTLTVKIEQDGIKTILGTLAESDAGKWVKVTFDAKIKDSVNFANLTPKQREDLGFETITENDPVESTKYPQHTGFRNQAKYSVTVKNGYEFTNIPSNIVTVVPPTSLTVEKKVTGTLGDLTKEFVFEITLTGLKDNGGNGNKRDYYYGSEVNGNNQVKVYTDSGLTTATFANGFNLKTESGQKVETMTLYAKIKGGQSLEIKGLPVGATYKVKEMASDHQPSYRLSDRGDVQWVNRKVEIADVGATIVRISGKEVVATNDMVGNIHEVASNVKVRAEGNKNVALETATETVDPGEIVIVTYTNHRDIQTETGIIKDTWPWNIILLVLLVLLAYDDQMRKIKNRLRIARVTA